LKIGTPLTAMPMGPSTTDVGVAAIAGFSGIFHALSPVKS